MWTSGEIVCTFSVGLYPSRLYTIGFASNGSAGALIGNNLPYSGKVFGASSSPSISAKANGGCPYQCYPVVVIARPVSGWINGFI